MKQGCSGCEIDFTDKDRKVLSITKVMKERVTIFRVTATGNPMHMHSIDPTAFCKKIPMSWAVNGGELSDERIGGLGLAGDLADCRIAIAYVAFWTEV